MIHKTMLCELLVFCTRATIIGEWINADTSSWSEYACHLYILGIHEPYKVFHDDIDTILMKISMISKAEQVEFQAFTLYHPYIRYILYSDFCKVRLSRYRA